MQNRCVRIFIDDRKLLAEIASIQQKNLASLVKQRLVTEIIQNQSPKGPNQINLRSVINLMQKFGFNSKI